MGGVIVYWGAENGQDAANGYLNGGAVFHVAERRWSTTPSSPIAGRFGAAAAGSDSLFFVWGGARTPDSTALFDGATYDVTTGSWRRLPPAPYLTARPLGAAWTGTEFVVITPGGCAAYNPTTNTWRSLPNLPGSPTAGTVVQVGDRTYVVGASSAYLARGASAWTPIPSLQNAVVATLTAATDGDTLFAAALTEARSGPVSVPPIVDRFDPATATWIGLPTSPVQEASCAVPLAVTANKLFLACSNSAIFDRQTATWRDYGPAASWGGGPGSVGGSDPVTVGGEIVFAGAPTLIYTGP
ncbi:MAG TPA: hypothetical protein VHX15_11850 [Frankiaceae bacterium]|nr:hypothetical protein [Frankiaceae bacterium]